LEAFEKRISTSDQHQGVAAQLKLLEDLQKEQQHQQDMQELQQQQQQQQQQQHQQQQSLYQTTPVGGAYVSPLSSGSSLHSMAGLRQQQAPYGSPTGSDMEFTLKSNLNQPTTTATGGGGGGGEPIVQGLDAFKLLFYELTGIQLGNKEEEEDRNRGVGEEVGGVNQNNHKGLRNIPRRLRRFISGILVFFVVLIIAICGISVWWMFTTFLFPVKSQARSAVTVSVIAQVDHSSSFFCFLLFLLLFFWLL
jgi:hypothetical protein